MTTRAGVTLVTRGATCARHRDPPLLQALLGWPEPDYAHHPLLAGADGQRLAKRDGAPEPALAARGGAIACRGARPGRVSLRPGSMAGRRRVAWPA
jgi:hypothetical protein